MPIRCGSTPSSDARKSSALMLFQVCRASTLRIVVRRLLRILPADHAIGIDGRTHAGQAGRSGSADRLESGPAV